MFVATCCLGIVCYVAYQHSSSSIAEKGRSTDGMKAMNESSFVYRSSTDSEYLFQFPPHSATEPLRGIMFVANGCSHSATDWFPPSPKCPHCRGLPEETSMVHFFLGHSFVVIVQSLSSKGREHRCWRSQRDTDAVTDTLLNFKRELRIEALPLYAFGEESGGKFVGSMATNDEVVAAVNLKGVIVQFSTIGIAPHRLQRALSVPVLFPAMARDERTLSFVRRQIALFKKRDSGSVSAICEMAPIKTDSLYFHHRIGGRMTAEISKNIFDGLKQDGYLDEHGFLVEDPRRSSWRECVAQSVGPGGLGLDESAILEEMNVAFSMHELKDKCEEQTLRFIQSIENKKP